MNIQFIMSDTTTGATTGALKDIISKAEGDVFSDVLVLVPETKSIAIERELLDYSKNGAFANIFVYSFVRLLSRIGGVKEQDIVSKQTCVMILRNIILENIEKLSCYKKTAKTISFAEKIYETIEQFKSSSYTVEDVKQLAEASTGALKAKMSDIALLFELFETELSKGYLDDCDRLRKLGELAKDNEFIRNADVYVVGFDNVTSDMVEVLRQFALNSKSITFSCVYFNDNRKDKHIQDNELYRKFKSIADRLKFPYNPKFVNSSHSGDFWQMKNYLYSTERKCVESCGNVQVFEFETKSKEIDALANLILSEVCKGKRFRDIAVIDANFEKDIDILAKTFTEYNIPFFITRAYDISSHSLIRFIKSAIEMAIFNYSAEKVLKCVSSTVIDIEGFAEFEGYVKAKGLNYARFFDEIKDIEDIVTSDKINNFIKFIKNFNQKFGQLFSKANSIANFLHGVEALLESVDAKNRLADIAQFEKQNSLEIESEISSVILDKVNKIHENMMRFLGDKIVSPLEFLQIYMSGFSEEMVNLVPVSVDSVFIQKNADGLYKIKDLFIVGAVDGVFPVHMADTGMLQDAELLQLSEIAQKNVEPTIKELNKREKFISYELMLLPSDRLFVLYSTHSFGAVNKPAEIVNRFVKLFDLQVKKTCKTNQIITQKIAEKKFAKQVGEFLSGEMISTYELNRDYNKIRNHFSKSFRNYISTLSFGEKEFKIEQARELYFMNNKSSVSQLERYFSCPYSFFARYGLRLKDNKDASLSSLDIGTIVHKFAELFTKQIKKFEGLDKKEFNKKVTCLFDESLNALSINREKNVAVLKFIADEANRLAEYLMLEQEKSSFKNESELNEYEFFGNNAVKIQVDENTLISIEGKIDRIDKFGDYVRVIDYKTGETNSDLDSIYFGKKIQLVSYLSAVEKINGGKVAGLFYLPIHSDFVKIQQKIKNNYKMQGFLLDDIDVIKYMDCSLSLENSESDFVPLKLKNNKETKETGELQISYGRAKNFLSIEEFDDVKNYTAELCKQALGEILDGNIAPAPFAKKSEKNSLECKYCEFAGFCGKEHAKFGDARRCGGDVTTASFSECEGGTNGI